ncbi:Neopullulanase 1 [Thermoflexales bacterium]|nr:Neopullulanase 1 [Thermoflexales bacterium]
MNHSHPLTRLGRLVLVLITALGLLGSVPQVTWAASHDNVVEVEGLGHEPLFDRYICEDESYPYRDPLNPRADQSIVIRMRSFTQDLTSVTLWYTTAATATEQSEWTSVTTAVSETTWLNCEDKPGWNMDGWSVVIPAQTSLVWYKIAYTDGTQTLWQRESGESDPEIFGADGGWEVSSTLLTYTPPSEVFVRGTFDSGTMGWNYDHFAVIQNGLNAVADEGQVTVYTGIYTESLTIARPLTLQRFEFDTPVIHGPCSTALINVSATPVVIANLTLKVNQATCPVGLLATGDYEQLRLAGNIIESTGSGADYIANTRGIDLDGSIALGVSAVGNLIRPENATAAKFEDGLRLTNAHGTIGGPTPDGNLITAHNAIRATDPDNSLRIEGNTLSGRTRLNNLLSGSGYHYFISNLCRTGDSGDNTIAPDIFALLEVNTVNATSLFVQNNEFQDFVNYGLFLGNFADSSIEHNTFTPLTHSDNTGYRHIHLNTKPHAANPLPSANAARLTLWHNTFYGNSANPAGGVALELANHASTGASAFQNISIGGLEDDANSFAYNIKTAIRLDPRTGNSDSLPMWTAPSCPDCSVTPMAPVFDDFDARENEFGDALDTYKRPLNMELTELADLEDRIDHQIDYAALGFVRMRSLNVYVTPRSYLSSYTTEPLIKRGIDAADAGDTVNVTTGVYTENIVVDKALTLAGMGQSNTIVYPALSNPNCNGGGSGVLCSGGDPAASNLVQVQADNVTLRDLTLDGDAPGSTSGLIRNGADLDARNGLVLGAFNNLTIRNSTLQNVYLNSLYLAGGSVSLSGATLNNQEAVFDQTSGALTAYANSIMNYATALTRTGGTGNLRHNWWGRANGTVPNGLDPATDWQARLSAQILSWTEGSNGAVLGDTSLAGGTGTAVIVSHGRSFVNAPFGNTIFDFDSMCSDYYDFFTVNGSGTWDISLPVDDSPACITQTLDAGKIYWIPAVTDYSVECTPYDNTACWDLITTNVITSGQNIMVTGLSATDLGGTQFVAGSIIGSDPTAVTIIALAASTDRSSAPAGAIFVSALVATVGLILVVRRRR